jgi:predicted RNase H-like nuclease
MRVAGVDGWRGGWVSVTLVDRSFRSAALHTTVADVVGLDVEIIGIDMPIGLPPPWPRAADREARRFVGRRAGSVFLTFPREVYEAATHADAVTRAVAATSAGISQQAYRLGPKVLELEDVARRDERLVEVHPEGSFRELAGHELPYTKRSWNGLMQRRRLLAEAGILVPDELPAGIVAPDDLLDAAVVAWTAERYARHEALALPATAAGRIGAIWR